MARHEPPLYQLVRFDGWSDWVNVSLFEGSSGDTSLLLHVPFVGLAGEGGVVEGFVSWFWGWAGWSLAWSIGA